jgi:hypothetical protein
MTTGRSSTVQASSITSPTSSGELARNLGHDAVVAHRDEREAGDGGLVGLAHGDALQVEAAGREEIRDAIERADRVFERDGEDVPVLLVGLVFLFRQEGLAKLALPADLLAGEGGFGHWIGWIFRAEVALSGVPGRRKYCVLRVAYLRT